MKAEQLLLYSLIIIALLLNFAGISHSFLSNDSGLYALISKNIIHSGDYHSLVVDGKSWLDKPHFQFWFTALFYKLFGVSDVVYRLASYFWFLIGCFYTYKIGAKYINKSSGLLSVLILLSTFHIFLSNEDVRAETMLLGMVVAAMYYTMGLIEKFSFKYIVLGAIFLGLSWMTKGLVALIPSAFGVIIYLFINKDYKNLFHVKWLILGLTTIVCILPEILSLQVQFGSGKLFEAVKWFAWDSQFTRFIGKGKITRPTSTPLEFFVNLLWASAPWIILITVSSYYIIKEQIIKKTPLNLISIPILGSVFTLLLLSLSKFQLPHYNNILYPFFALGIAYYITINSNEIIIKSQTIISILLLALIIIELVILGIDTLDYFALFILIALIYFCFKTIQDKKKRTIIYTCIVVLFCSFTISRKYYTKRIFTTPDLEIATFLNDNYKGIPITEFNLQKIKHPFHFYLDAAYEIVKVDNLDFQKHSLILTQYDQIKYLHWQDIGVDTLKSWHYQYEERLNLNALSNDSIKLKKEEQLVLLRLYKKVK